MKEIPRWRGAVWPVGRLGSARGYALPPGRKNLATAPAAGTTACPTHAAAIMATTSGWQAHPGPGDPTGWWAATAMSWSQGVESVWVPPAPGNII